MAETPALTLLTKATSSGPAPTNRATSPRASLTKPGLSRENQRWGWTAIRARSSFWAAITGPGTAP